MIDAFYRTKHHISSILLYYSQMAQKQQMIAVDFDGVINERGTLIPMAREGLQELIDRGYRVVIHTLRARSSSGRATVIDWLNKYDLPYHDVTAVKPPALAFIDDRAIHFTNWPEVLKVVDLRDPLSMLE